MDSTSGERLPKWFRTVDERLGRFTAGLSTRELTRLFEKEASNAYSVLTRERRAPETPSLPQRIKVIFLGFLDHLGPTRRVIFLLSLALAALGALGYGLTLELLQGRIVFDASPLWFLPAIGGLLFLLALEIVDQVRVRDELEIARDLQRELLPKTAPETPGYEILHSYRTANEVGGDYYDFQLIDQNRLAIMVGDASGHGIAAGLLMAIANATLKLAIELDPRPEMVLRLLNTALFRTGDRRAFMSLFYGVLELDSGVLEYSSAGHPYPMLRRQDGEVEELGQGGFPLGVRPEIVVETEVARLDPGDLIVLYSDGLPEANSPNDHSFGYARLDLLVRGAATPSLAQRRILDGLEDHLGDREIQDDFSLVIMGRKAPLPPVPRLGDTVN